MKNQNETNGNGAPRLTIGAVSERTGLSIHVLRAWERRYGAVTPARSPGRQRLYTEAEVARLRLLREATATGRTIGQVARLSTEELRVLVGRSGERERLPSPRPIMAPVPEREARAAGEWLRGIIAAPGGER